MFFLPGKTRFEWAKELVAWRTINLKTIVFTDENNLHLEGLGDLAYYLQNLRQE